MDIRYSVKYNSDRFTKYLLSIRRSVLSRKTEDFSEFIAEIDLLLARIREFCNDMGEDLSLIMEKSQQSVSPPPNIPLVSPYLGRSSSLLLKSRWSVAENPDFRQSGLGLGDVLMSLAPVKACGIEGRYFVTCMDAPYSYSPTHPYADMEYRKKTYPKLVDFVLSQPYIVGGGIVDWTNGKEYDMDFDWVRWWPVHDNEDMIVRYMEMMGLPLEFDFQWLFVEKTSVLDTSGCIVISEAPRHAHKQINHSFLGELGRDVVFLGFKEEYEGFIKNYGMDVIHLETKDFFETADAIGRSALFISTLTSGIVFADGLQTKRILIKWPVDCTYYSSHGLNTETVLDQVGYEDAVRRALGCS